MELTFDRISYLGQTMCVLSIGATKELLFDRLFSDVLPARLLPSTRDEFQLFVLVIVKVLLNSSRFDSR